MVKELSVYAQIDPQSKTADDRDLHEAPIPKLRFVGNTTLISSMLGFYIATSGAYRIMSFLKIPGEFLVAAFKTTLRSRHV